MTELTEVELAILAELDADDGIRSYAEHEAHNRQLKESCLAAKGRHYQSINKRKRHV